VRQQRRCLEPAELRRQNITCRTISLHQLDDTARAHPKLFGDLPTRASLRDSLDDLQTEIIRIRFGHPWLASSSSHHLESQPKTFGNRESIPSNGNLL